ncbi:hypothetical protein POTOM_059316 [Populus tomentosa]|uniref:Uncharacterized protein n=1 Tax=Populus tomentosa TaxID=118781 RepID=A0A8X7XSL8_POPTO|nr:hypothetical protein POTOM_059316 [Populus tomentosa]
MSMVIVMIFIAISMVGMMRSSLTQITYLWDLIPVWMQKEEEDMFSEYKEVSVKFQLEDMNDNFLPLDLCQVLECGVHLLYKDGIHHFDLIMLGFSRFHPLDGDGLEARFQAKRARSPIFQKGYLVLASLKMQLRSGLAIKAGDLHCKLNANHFRNVHGDSHDLYRYLYDEFDERLINSENIVMRFDPCLVAKEKDMFSIYNEVSLEYVNTSIICAILACPFSNIAKIMHNVKKADFQWARVQTWQYNLRLLKIYNSEAGKNCKVYLPNGLKSLSDELRYLHWDGYPLKSLPSNFHPENLVELNLSHSKVRELWKGDQNLVNLTELHKPFESPRIIKSKYLKALNLSGCSYLKMYPETTEHVMYLNFNETAIKELPQSMGHLSRLVALNLRDCKQLGNLPDSICLLKSIVIVDVSGCSNVTKLPSIPGNTRYLYLSGTAVEEFPFSVGHLWRISSLDLSNCRRLKNLPSTIYELAYLQKLNLSGCSNITEFPNVSCNIKELYLDGTTIEEIPSSIGCFYKLVELHLRNCTKFKILPGSICKLKSLQKLNLSGCSQFQRFPGILETMESLRYLYLDRTGIEKLPSPIRNLKGLCFLELGNCIYLEGKYHDDLRLLEQDVDLKYLRKLNLSGCGILEVPKRLGCLTSLEALDLSGNNFVILPKNISELSELTPLLEALAAGVSSFCFPGCKVPAWFVQQNSAASVTIQLPSHCPSSELLGFMLCTVVAFEPSYDDSGGFQSDHLFLGYDPCLNATKDFWYGNFSEVSVEFSVEDMDNNSHYCHRCHDNKRDNEAEPSGSGFKNGAESTTNDLKSHSVSFYSEDEILWFLS